MVQNPPANARDIGDIGSIPGSGRSPGGGHGNPLLYSCLENPMEREAWRARVHEVTKESDTIWWLNDHDKIVVESKVCKKGTFRQSTDKSQPARAFLPWYLVCMKSTVPASFKSHNPF